MIFVEAKTAKKQVNHNIPRPIGFPAVSFSCNPCCYVNAGGDRCTWGDMHAIDTPRREHLPRGQMLAQL